MRHYPAESDKRHGEKLSQFKIRQIYADLRRRQQLENMRRASDCETAFVDVEGLAIITMLSPLFAAKANGIDRIKAGISSKILIGGNFSIENRFCGIRRMQPCRQES